MTERIKTLEKHYRVRLLIRTTRSVSLTEEGREFYAGCERVLAELEQTEARLQTGQESIAEPLRVTATSDLGRQHIAVVLSQFAEQHPDVMPCLHLSDGLVNLTEERFDIGVRYGVLSDSTMVARKLADNRRLLCASPEYLRQKGTPQSPAELLDHDCLGMIRATEPLTTWYFQTATGPQSVNTVPARTTNDGVIVRRWALEGAGIALKSYWDVANDLKNGSLVTILDDCNPDFELQGTTDGADLHVVYPAREFLPLRTRSFVEALIEYFSMRSIMAI